MNSNLNSKRGTMSLAFAIVVRAERGELKRLVKAANFTGGFGRIIDDVSGRADVCECMGVTVFHQPNEVDRLDPNQLKKAAAAKKVLPSARNTWSSRMVIIVGYSKGEQ